MKARVIGAVALLSAFGLGACLGISDVDHTKSSTGGAGGAGTGGAAGSVGSGGACWGDQKACDGQCVSKNDVQTGCGAPSCEPCNLPHATAICGADGQCGIGTCESGWQNCDADSPLGTLTGCEAHTEFDPTACGSSCTNCIATQGSDFTCVKGQCTAAICPAGKQDCDGVPGCEIDKNDVNNCGFCGNVCSFPHAVAACNADPVSPTGYGCDFSCSSASYADCNGVKSDGCETNLDTDPANCGTCGKKCNAVNGASGCSAGKCQTACNPGWGDCDSNPDNGCETSLKTLTDCGLCGSACLPMHANGPTCATGTCNYTTCQPGWGDCNGIKADGCESALGSPTNCTGCGIVCSPPHAQGATCATGSCKFTSCVSGWGDCDSNYANGCETSLNTLTNCGSCGTACTKCCTNGVCQAC